MRSIHVVPPLFVLALTACATTSREHPLVIATDFGVVDGAVSAMKGVALGIAPDLVVHDLTQEIAPYDIWEGAFRIAAAAPFWPAGSVIVGVVDPGVGTTRRPIVLATKSGHFFVGPDNGLFTLVARDLGTLEVREIDVARHLRGGSAQSHTFHGRDLFVVVGAGLAAGSLALGDVGPRLATEMIQLEIPAPAITQEAGGAVLSGVIAVLDARYGNVWSNVPAAMVAEFGVKLGDTIDVRVVDVSGVRFEGAVPFVNTFGDVPEGQPLAYLNSGLELSLALNLGDFAAKHGIAAGPGWRIEVRTQKR